MNIAAKRFERQLSAISVLAALPLGALIYFVVQPPEWATSVGAVHQAAIIVAGLVLYLAALLLVRVMSRKLKILGQFEAATRRLTSGDYSRQIDTDVKDEFQALGKAFNDLTAQLQESLKTSRALGDIDRLILAAANMDTILFKVLASARMEAIAVSLLLRHDMKSAQVSVHQIKERSLAENAVSLPEVTKDSLRDVEGYRMVANKVSGDNILECIPVAEEGKITGVLVASGHRSLSASESKRLTDLADRLSVAVTNIRRSDSLFQQAHFDSLTGLINRHAFEEKLRECLAQSKRGDGGVLLFLDLDGFKKVNDTEGHEAGDRLLVMVGDRLREIVRPADTIARLGGDEFAIIVPGCSESKTIVPLCERIIDAVTKPVVVARMEHTIGTSIGIAVYPRDGQQLDELVMKADSAMYRAKETGGSRFAFFDDELDEANRYRVLVESRLRSAIKRGDLEVHFQPQMNVRLWTVDSAEALMRWRDDQLGAVTPNTFVSIAEETSLIHEFMAILVDETAKLIAAAEQTGAPLQSVAVNASPRQLMTEGFALSLLSLMDRRGLAREHLEVEVTESVFARDTEQVVRELDTLRSAGVKIALDDFGTGYSSLNMLRELPLDSLKIDRAFITELESSNEAQTMVRHLISLARSIGLNVVAEGVETEVQLEHLLDSDCDYIQGFLISRALPLQDFVEALLGWQSNAQTRGQASIDLSARIQ